MNDIKYYFLMILFIAAEIGITYGLFVFVSVSKWLYSGFSAILLIASLVYINYSRYKEKIKIKPKRDVQNGYKKVFLYIISIFIGIAVVLVLSRAVFFLIQ